MHRCTFWDDGFGRYTALVPYALSGPVPGHPDMTVATSMLAYSEAMNVLLGLEGVLTYAYRPEEEVYVVGVMWMGPLPELQGVMGRVAGTLAALPGVSLLDPYFDFGSAVPEQDHTHCVMMDDGAVVHFQFKDAEGKIQYSSLKAPGMEEAWQALVERWNALEAEGCAVERVQCPFGAAEREMARWRQEYAEEQARTDPEEMAKAWQTLGDAIGLLSFLDDTRNET